MKLAFMFEANHMMMLFLETVTVEEKLSHWVVDGAIFPKI